MHGCCYIQDSLGSSSSWLDALVIGVRTPLDVHLIHIHVLVFAVVSN